jgi:hypothetical protein
LELEKQLDATATLDAYENVKPSWSELFFNILTKPIDTLKQLDHLCNGEMLFILTQQAFNTVFLTAFLLGCVRINPNESLLSIFEILSVIANEMIFWVIAAGLLSLLSTIITNAKPTRWKKALVLTGWSMTPIIFFAPMMCFKNVLGAWVLPFATIPTWWTLFLLCASYKIALGIHTRKLLVIAFVLPPLLFLVYVFWSGLSLIMLLSEIASAFQR